MTEHLEGRPETLGHRDKSIPLTFNVRARQVDLIVRPPHLFPLQIQELPNPTRAANQLAHVFANVADRQQAFWNGYREYEKDFERNPSRQQTRQQFFTVIEQQAEYEYIDRTYRERFDLNAVNLYLEFKYPLAANAFVLPRGFNVTELTKSLTEEWYEAARPSLAA